LRGRFVNAMVMLAGVIVWAVKRPDRCAAHSGPSARAPRMPDGRGYRTVVTGNVDRTKPPVGTGPIVASHPLWPDPPFCVVYDPRHKSRWSFATPEEYAARIGRLPLSEHPCISFQKRALSAVPTQRCPKCGNWLNPGETHAPRPPRPSDVVRTDRVPAIDSHDDAFSLHHSPLCVLAGDHDDEIPCPTYSD
jgi:hypothetical protein